MISAFAPARRLAPGAFVPLFLVALAVVPGNSAQAHASNLIVDGGFESAGGGNIYGAGQSIDGGSWKVTLGDIYIDTQDPYVFAGSNALNLTYASLYAPDSVSQTVSTTPGQSYIFSFWGDSDSPNTFSVTENGAKLSGLPSSIVGNGFPSVVTNGNSSLFVDYTTEFVATSASTTLTLTSTANPALGSADGSVMIDNVSLQPTPEPESVVLSLTGMVCLGLAFARKRLRAFSIGAFNRA
jgi:hypothetical protein